MRYKKLLTILFFVIFIYISNISIADTKTFDQQYDNRINAQQQNYYGHKSQLKSLTQRPSACHKKVQESNNTIHVAPCTIKDNFQNVYHYNQHGEIIRENANIESHTSAIDSIDLKNNFQNVLHYNQNGSIIKENTLHNPQKHYTIIPMTSITQHQDYCINNTINISNSSNFELSKLGLNNIVPYSQLSYYSKDRSQVISKKNNSFIYGSNI